MKISDDRILRELQDEFHEVFPFLKIEFYKAGDSGEGSSFKYLRLDPSLRLESVRKVHSSGFLKLDCHLTVEAFEQTVRKVFGLHVQVFRKSFGQWIEARSEDSWTLKEQNLRGMLTQNLAQQ